MSIFYHKEIEAMMEADAKYAEDTFHLVQPLLERPASGYALTLRYGPRDNFMQRKFVIAKPDPENLANILDLSEEKIWRPTRLNHLTSLESADKSKLHYAGGIVYIPWSAGISGCAGLDDHCLVIANAVRTNTMSINAAYGYAGKDHEVRLNRFLKALPQRAV